MSHEKKCPIHLIDYVGGKCLLCQDNEDNTLRLSEVTDFTYPFGLDPSPGPDPSSFDGFGGGGGFDGAGAGGDFGGD